MLALPMMGKLADASEVTAVVDYVFTGNGSVNTLLAGNAVATNVSHYLGLLARIALGDGTAAGFGLEWLEAA